MKNWLKSGTSFVALGVLLISATSGMRAQQVAPAPSTNARPSPEAQQPAFTPETAAATADEEQVVKLSPFEVSAPKEDSYTAATTLAGNRLNTELRDIGNAVTVVTSQFLKDIAATDNQTLLQYTTNTEVGGIYGNFAGAGDSSHLDESFRFTNPNQNTRVRGLTSADNTREYFLTDIPWEGYNVDGVDLQRGPNSILFGQGSPAGIINTRLKQASFKDSNEVSFRAGSWGSNRTAVDFNKVLLKNELAIRVAAVRNDEEYKQDPAHSLQKRIYGAVRYEPSFLKKGNARTVIKANIEFGKVNSNTPRELPPNDQITPWWSTGTYVGHNLTGAAFNYPYLNKLTVSPQQNEDDNSGVPNHGFARASHNGPGGVYPGNPAVFPPTVAYSGSPNEYFQPWVGDSMSDVYSSPAFVFQYNNAAQGNAINWEPTGNHGMATDGSNRTRLDSVMIYQRPASVASYSIFAKNARLYYGDLPAWQFGIYKDKSLTDPSVFDFYNQLLDGPTKWEWQNFRTYNMSLDQTFFNDQVGFEATYNNEWYKSGNVRLLQQDSLNIDFNRVYSDGSPTGKNGVPFEDGTPNPNYGKPYVGFSGRFGNHNDISNRQAGRVTVFGDYDFNKNHTSWLTRLVGRHIVTGLLATDRRTTDSREFTRYSIDDPAWEASINGSATDSPKVAFTDYRMQPYTMIYLGNSLQDASTASGAHIPNVKVNPTLTSGQVINFDATWKPSTNPADPTYVDPGAFWYNNYYPTVNPIAVAPDGLYRDGSGNVVVGPGASTQSNNPANYVGFRNYPINIIDSLSSPAMQDRNTINARLTKSTVFSRAFDWQAHLWDNAIVGTFGIRQDIAKSWQFSLTTNSDSSLTSNNQRLDLSPGNYYLDPLGKPNPKYSSQVTAYNRLQVRSKAWTVMGHLNQLPYMKWLPLQVSVFYNHSTDFQPAAQRVDLYGVPLSAPQGETKDQGILLETMDGKYSLRVNKYKTTSTNASSSGLGGAWFIGASQAWAANWVNRFEFNWTGDTSANAVAVNDPNNNEYNYSPAPGETLAQAQAREASVITAFRAWQASVDPRFYAAWGINLNDHTKGVNANVPNGFAVTEDSVSKGYEIEFNANPTRNWRISVNASKANAERSNIGGTNLRAFIAAYEKALNTPGAGYWGVVGGVGDLRIWWGGAGNETTLFQWNNNIGSEYHQRALQEGTNVPELRTWHYNAITNYTFDKGFLRGGYVGGGVRYQSDIVIGYKPIAGATANSISFDIANPYKGPALTDFDLWVGYSRKLWANKIGWSIQLNIRNVGVGNKLIPITTEPDGTPATYRIRPPQVFTLTNTFNF